MGYNTEYEVRVIEKPAYVREVDIAAFIEFIPDDQATMAVSPDGDCLQSEDEARWYNHEVDMVRLSNSYPDLVFQLDGQGQELEDRWRKYFKGGKMQAAKAVITLEPYDPKKLIALENKR